MNRSTGYRVEILLAIGGYIEYTARKKPVSLESAEAYATGLKRQGQGGRIVEAHSGQVVDVWPTQKEEVMKLKKIERGVYSATINKAEAIVAFTRRNRGKQEFLTYGTVFSTKQISRAKALAKESGAALWIATEVLLNGTYQFSYAMPGESWAKYKVGVAEFPMNPKARALYATDSTMLSGFNVIESEGVPVAMKAVTVKPKPVREELAVAAESPKPGMPDMEAEIARLQEAEGLSRKSAMQRIRRAAKKGGK